MRWFKPNLRNSLHALFSVTTPATVPAQARWSLEDVRERMLALLPAGEDDRLVSLRRRLRYADDPEALWFMRGELMGHLARQRGESWAYEQLALLGEMFTDLLPSGLRSRPSPLSRSNGQPYEGD
jgi:hypothetical protein